MRRERVHSTLRDLKTAHECAASTMSYPNSAVSGAWHLYSSDPDSRLIPVFAQEACGGKLGASSNYVRPWTHGVQVRDSSTSAGTAAGRRLPSEGASVTLRNGFDCPRKLTSVCRNDGAFEPWKVVEMCASLAHFGWWNSSGFGQSGWRTETDTRAITSMTPLGRTLRRNCHQVDVTWGSWQIAFGCWVTDARSGHRSGRVE